MNSVIETEGGWMKLSTPRERFSVFIKTFKVLIQMLNKMMNFANLFGSSFDRRLTHVWAYDIHAAKFCKVCQIDHDDSDLCSGESSIIRKELPFRQTRSDQIYQQEQSRQIQMKAHEDNQRQMNRERQQLREMAMKSQKHQEKEQKQMQRETNRMKKMLEIQRMKLQMRQLQVKRREVELKLSEQQKGSIFIDEALQNSIQLHPQALRGSSTFSNSETDLAATGFAQIRSEP